MNDNLDNLDNLGNIARARTIARVAGALAELNDRMDGEQVEDVERFLMQHLGMDAVAVTQMLAVFAEEHNVDVASALVLFMWGVQASVNNQRV